MIISNFKIFYDNLKKLSYNSNFASKCTVSCSVTRNAVKGGHRDAKNQKKKFFFFGALRNVYVKGHPNSKIFENAGTSVRHIMRAAGSRAAHPNYFQLLTS